MIYRHAGDAVSPWPGQYLFGGWVSGTISAQPKQGLFEKLAFLRTLLHCTVRIDYVREELEFRVRLTI